MKDYYYILGLKPNANLQEIKTAYRKLSKKFHPDVNNGDPFFTERFKEIQEAYETLSNTNKRKRYNNNNYDHQTEPEREEPALPNIKTFATDKANYVINETVKITWEVLNAEKVNINLFDSVSDNGVKSIKFKKPKDDLAITLNAINEQGSKVTETIHITIDGYTEPKPDYEFEKESNSFNWSKIFIETGILAIVLYATYLIYLFIESKVGAAFLFSKLEAKEERLYLPTTINTLFLLIPALFAYLYRKFKKEIKTWFKLVLSNLRLYLERLAVIVSKAIIWFSFICLGLAIAFAVGSFISEMLNNEKQIVIEKQANNTNASHNRISIGFEDLQKIRLSKIYQTLPKLNNYGSQNDFKKAMLESRTNREKLYNKLPSLQKIGTFEAIESYLNSPMESLIELPFKKRFKIGDESLMNLYQGLFERELYTNSYTDFVAKYGNDKAAQKKLFNGLSKMGLYSKSESDFINQFFTETSANLSLEKLFNKLKNDNYDLPESLNEFTNLLTKEGKLLSLHKTLIDDGYNLPNNIHDFAKDLGLSKVLEKTVGQEINATLISNFKGNQLENGASPYEYYFGESVFESNSLHSIKFKASKTSDVIVCLAKIYDNKIIRHEYIRKGETFEMTKIPDGTYYLKSIYGNDWNPNKMIFNKQVQGAFDTDLSFSKSDDITDRFLFNKERAADGISYSTYEVTLYLVKHGNMESEKINENEFFK